MPPALSNVRSREISVSRARCRRLGWPLQAQRGNRNPRQGGWTARFDPLLDPTRCIAVGVNLRLLPSRRTVPGRLGSSGPHPLRAVTLPFLTLKRIGAPSGHGHHGSAWAAGVPALPACLSVIRPQVPRALRLNEGAMVLVGYHAIRRVTRTPLVKDGSVGLILGQASVPWEAGTRNDRASTHGAPPRLPGRR